MVSRDSLAVNSIEISTNLCYYNFIEPRKTKTKQEIREIGTKNPHDAPVSLLERGEIALNDFEAGDSRGAYQLIGGKYVESLLKDEDTRERLESNLQKIDDLREKDEANFGEPSASGYILIAHNESYQNIKHTLALLKKQSNSSAEVVLYANYPSTLNEEDKVALEERVTSAVAEFDSDNQTTIRLRPLFSQYEPEDLTPARLRKDCGDLIAADGLRRGFKFDHPMFVLDADIRNMSSDTLENLTRMISGEDSSEPMVVSAVNFNTSSSEQGSAQRLTRLTELIRRAERTIKPYREECGTALSIGAYSLIGGYYTADATSENYYPLMRLKNNHETYKILMKRIKPDAEPPTSDVQYIRSARITLSSRRTEQYFFNLLELITNDPDKANALLSSPLARRFPPYVDLAAKGGLHSKEVMSHTERLRADHITTSLAGVAFEKLALQIFLGKARWDSFTDENNQPHPDMKIQKALLQRYIHTN